MTKLQKFNNIIFAVIGGGFILFVAGSLLIMALFELIKDNKPADSPLSNEEIKGLLENKLFKQTVSYDKGHWAWSEKRKQKDGTIKEINSPYYIIPVSQVTLEDSKQLSQGTVRGELDSSGSNYSFYKSYSSKYNNILIYNSTNGQLDKVFNQRILIEQIMTYKYHSELFMVLRTKDLSAPKDQYDIIETDIYYYTFSDKSLNKIEIPNVRVHDFTVHDELPFILVQGKIDFDSNGKIDKHDPTRLFSWDFETNQISSFPRAEITEDLQKTLQGSNLTE